MKLKNFLAFKESSWNSSKWLTYEYDDGQKWHLREGGQGFQLETVEKYPQRFLLADSEGELKALIANDDHISAHGDGKSGDFQCPKCGYWYIANPYSEFEAGLNENWRKNITCICGQKFVGSIKEVNIIYQTKTL
mgnify:FL=1